MRDSAATVGVGIDDELLDEILLEIYNEEVDEVSGISPTLYTANRDYFHKAIDDGIINSANAAIDLDTAWIGALKHSADVFSLHRTANQCALLAESMIDADGNLKTFEQFKKDTQAINNHYNKAWLRTEYDTAVLRTQMGADWMMFMKDADVLPNLRWMQTTSVNPREEHREFWANNLTLPIDDPFWDKHRPGDQWNCKCWLEQTEAPRTALEDMPDSADIPEPKAGLRGNTAKTKEIFSQDHPHFPNKCAICHLNTDGKVHGIKGDNKVKNGIIKGNCTICKVAKSCEGRINKACNELPTISPIIKSRLKGLKTQKEKQNFLRAIQQSEKAPIIKVSESPAKDEYGITRMYDGCQGPESKSWPRTKQLAFDLNKHGIDVTFLAEHRDLTCADAIVMYKGNLVIADFKCSATLKPNTLFHDLEKGYKQASVIVLKLEQMGESLFIESINQFIRKYEDRKSKNYKSNSGIRLGKMILVNKNGDLVEIDRKEFFNLNYIKKIKEIL